MPCRCLDARVDTSECCVGCRGPHWPNVNFCLCKMALRRRPRPPLASALLSDECHALACTSRRGCWLVPMEWLRARWPPAECLVCECRAARLSLAASRQTQRALMRTLSMLKVRWGPELAKHGWPWRACIAWEGRWSTRVVCLAWVTAKKVRSGVRRAHMHHRVLVRPFQSANVEVTSPLSIARLRCRVIAHTSPLGGLMQHT